jgi:hypothetical protein
MMTLELSKAILVLLENRPSNKRQLSDLLSSQGYSDCDTSKVIKSLYRLAAEGRIRKIDVNPPIWLVCQAATGEADPLSPRLSRSKSVSHSGPSQSFRERTTAETKQLVWDAALTLLNRRGDHLSIKRTASDVARSTGVRKKRTRKILAAGKDGVVVREERLSLTPSMRALAAIWPIFRDHLLTPAGNPRVGPVIVTSKAPQLLPDLFEIRILTVDATSSPFWVCAHIADLELWHDLFEEAQTLDAAWEIPLLPATEFPTALPAPLIWRLPTAEAAVYQVATILNYLPAFTYEALLLKKPPVPLEQLTTIGAEVRRLVARRGTISRGRKYPVAGYCDRCKLPLSDPYSLLVGIGPVCREYYDPEVVKRVASTSITASDHADPSGEAEAVHALQVAWRRR